MDDSKTIQAKSSRRSKFKWKFKYFPIRYMFTFLAFLGVSNVYILRSNLNIAIVNMAIAPNTSVAKSTACQHLIPKRNTSNDKPVGEFRWNSAVQGQALGIISIGYMLTPIPMSIFTIRYGAKWVFGLSVLFGGLLTFATEAASRYSVWALIGLRFLEGLFLGVSLPTMHALVGKWIPQRERSRHQSVIFSGIPFGTIVAYIVSGFLIDYKILGGWPGIFYLSGISACIWFIAWAILISETPKQNLLISKAELKDTRNEVDYMPEVRRYDIPLRDILLSVSVHCLVITSFCNNWGFYTMLDSTPSYLARVLHIQMKTNGVVSSLPYILYILLCITGGVMSDAIRASRYFSITAIRKMLNSLAFYLPGLCLLIIPLIGCFALPVVVLLSFAAGFNGMKYSGFLVTPLDMTPEYAGIIVAIMSTVGQLAGFAAPAFNGWVTIKGDTLRNWGIVFYISSIFLVVGGTVFNLFGNAEMQQWGREHSASKCEMIDEQNVTEGRHVIAPRIPEIPSRRSKFQILEEERINEILNTKSEEAMKKSYDEMISDKDSKDKTRERNSEEKSSDKTKKKKVSK